MCFEWNRELFFLQAKIDFELEFALNGTKKCFFNILVMDDEGDEWTYLKYFVHQFVSFFFPIEFEFEIDSIYDLTKDY